ncbi:MAG: hypothetical protein EXS36_07605, partial [Pedosphaera sp.]|nr:hypothetical protein [Pedosphaera sp.]
MNPYFAPEGLVGFEVISPFETFELMSYCRGIGVNPFQWPSKHTYDALAAKLRARYGPALQSTGNPQQYLLISGLIDWKNQTAQFNPFGKANITSPPRPPAAGEYELQLRTASGTPLQTVLFEPIGLESGPPPGTPHIVPFFLPLLPDPAIKPAVLRHGGVTMATVNASPTAPVVEVFSPNGGEILASYPAILRWRGSDADGDKLVYDVQFSP